MSILESNKECLNCWFARVSIGWSSSHYGIIVMNVLTSIEKIELVVSFPSLFLDSRKGSRICGSPFWSDQCKFLLEVHTSEINILPTFISLLSLKHVKFILFLKYFLACLDKWWEFRKVSIRGLLVDPIPNSPN